MSEGEVSTLLRAVGQVEGKLDGIINTLAEMARRNEQRDAEAGNHETRISSLEEWRGNTKDGRRSVREWIGPLAAWLAAIASIIYAFSKVHGG